MAKGEKKDLVVITISDHFRVLVDNYNHELQTLEDVVNPKTRETRQEWKFIGYYPNISQCIRKASRYKVMSNNEALTLDSYLLELLQCSKEFGEEI